MYGCVFDDLHGLISRDDVGLDHILFETDYPHSDGTFPHSRKIAHELFEAAGMNAEECYKVLRGNAIAAYGLDRFGITRSSGDARHRCRATERAARARRPPQRGGRTGCSTRSSAPAGVTVADYLVLGVVRRSPGHRSDADRDLRGARPHDRRHDAHARPAGEGRAGAPLARSRPTGAGSWWRSPTRASRSPPGSTPTCTAGRSRSTSTTSRRQQLADSLARLTDLIEQVPGDLPPPPSPDGTTGGGRPGPARVRR